jgi:hypothetical protein
MLCQRLQSSVLCPVLCVISVFLWGFVSIFQCKNGNISETLAYIDITHRSGGRPLLKWYLCERDVGCVEDEL